MNHANVHARRKDIRVLIASILICSAFPAFAAPTGAWQKLLSDPGVLACDLSCNDSWISATLGKDGTWKHETMQVWCKKSASGGWEGGAELSVANVEYAIDKNFSFLYEKQEIKDPEMIKKWELDSIMLKRDGAKAIKTSSLAGKQTKEKTMDFPAGTSQNNVLSLQLRALAKAGKTTDIELAIFIGGQKLDAALAFSRTVDPFGKTGNYTFPAAMRTALAGKDYLVADLQLTGLYSAVYPHHFYFVLDPTADFSFVASWGGKASDCQYQWKKK